MAKNWSEVRSAAVESGRIDDESVASARKALTEEVRAHRLADVRRSQHVTQKSLAAGMKVSQARVSKIETGHLSRTELGTLQSYVEALGGRLRIVADFGDASLTVGD